MNGAPVIVLGLTFKEDCPDLRNSRVEDIINELNEYRCNVYVHDPLADPDEATAEYGVTLTAWRDLPRAQAVILAVPHRQYRDMAAADFAQILDKDSILIDVKACVDRTDLATNGIKVWRL